LLWRTNRSIERRRVGVVSVTRVMMAPGRNVGCGDVRVLFCCFFCEEVTLGSDALAGTVGSDRRFMDAMVGCVATDGAIARGCGDTNGFFAFATRAAHRLAGLFTFFFNGDV
jgi:hypothetical protein